MRGTAQAPACWGDRIVHGMCVGWVGRRSREDRTFFTCTSSQLAAAARSVGAQMPGSALSAYGCALIFSRLRRRLEAAGVGEGGWAPCSARPCSQG